MPQLGRNRLPDLIGGSGRRGGGFTRQQGGRKLGVGRLRAASQGKDERGGERKWLPDEKS
ncbi:hypothetical protein A8B98_03525 [Hymenobacter sp. UV11]|nr:hypothetical protein A8B98_03525 [Hymenobacter sp. UV11]